MAFIIWLLSACTADSDRHGQLRMIDPEPRWQDDVLGIHAGIDFQPGPRIVEALNHGVTIHIRLATRVGPRWKLLAVADQTRNHRFEIRYLPLIRHYELTDLKTGEQWSYPRLSMTLDALAEPRWMDTRFTADQRAGRRWRMQARIDIDRTRLPSPMRLPVWFDRNWGLGESWHSWELRSSGKTVDG